MNGVLSFLPIVNENSKVLILGTAPGAISLKKQQYYANPRNQFWKLIFTLFGENEVPDNYDRKIDFLLRHGIALWDVIAHCEREGSLDANIKAEKPNDFQSFFKAYPNIKCIAFNGSKAFEVFNKKIPDEREFMLIKLPSSSPARAIPFELKQMKWELLKELPWR